MKCLKKILAGVLGLSLTLTSFSASEVATYAAPGAKVAKATTEEAKWTTSADEKWTYRDFNDGIEVKATAKLTQDKDGKNIVLEDLQMPSMIDGKTVRKLADRCFAANVVNGGYESSSLIKNNVTLPYTLTHIGSGTRFRLHELILPPATVWADSMGSWASSAANDSTITYSPAVHTLVILNPEFDVTGQLGDIGLGGSHGSTMYYKGYTNSTIYNELEASNQLHRFISIGTYDPVTGEITSNMRIKYVKINDHTYEVGSVLKTTVGGEIDLENSYDIKPSPIEANYQWKKADSPDGPFVDIPGATGPKYTLAEEDMGKYIKVDVKGTGNTSGKASDILVPPGAPTIQGELTKVSISGIVKSGEQLKATVEPAQATANYQWQRGSSINGTFTDIAGATNSLYIPNRDTDEDSYLRVIATGIGAITGVVEATTEERVSDKKEISSITVTGDKYVGENLTATTSPTNATVTYQWQRSPSDSDSYYTDIEGATSSTYKLTEDDVKNYIRVKATGTGDYTGSIKYWSAYIYARSLSVKLTGDTYVGETLTATTNPVDATVTYQWQRSPNAGTYTDIEGATSSTYKLTEDDVKNYIRVKVTGTKNFAGDTPTSNSEWISTRSLSVKLTGDTYVGETLTATTNPVDATVTYQWQRSPNGSAYTDIEGATSSTYKLTEDDQGKYIRVIVTGTKNFTGATTDTEMWISTRSLSVTVTGDKYVGETLTATTSPTNATVTYQWQRSPSSSSGYTDIEGATSSTYKLVEDDQDKYIRVIVTGTKNFTGATTTSSYIYISARRLAVIITGDKYVGGTSTATTSPADATVTYQWQRGTSNSDSYYTDIEGATSGTYNITEDDLGKYIRVNVTGTGDYTGLTDTEYYIVNARNLAVSIKGDGYINETLSAVTDPMDATVKYQWRRGSTNIEGATSSTYTLSKNDGSSVEVVVTGTGNYIGSSATSRIYTRGLAVSITGDAYAGGTLKADVAPKDEEVTYQWQRGDANIEGATSSTYKVLETDLGKNIRVIVTGTNNYNGATATDYARISARSLSVTVTGDKYVGETLTATTDPVDATVTYQWQRGTSLNYSDRYYTDIEGATSSTYKLTEDDQGNYICVKVTGTKNFTGATTTSDTARIYARNLSVKLTGNKYVGETLTATTDPVDATVTYQWQRGTSPSSTYTDIEGATSSTYKLTEDDVKNYIRVKVTGTKNFTGATTTSSYIYISTRSLSVTVTGDKYVGETLTATTDPVDATVTYQWQRSPYNSDSYYTDIEGATSSTHKLVEDDQGNYIRVKVTGTKNFAGATPTSNSAQISARSLSVTITDGNYAGETLTATTDPVDATVTYQWQRSPNDSTYTDIDGATDRVYKLVKDDVDKYIRVKVTGTKNFTGATATDSKKILTLLGVSVTGYPYVGEVLTIAAHPADATVTYQWKQSDTGYTYYDIEGATSSTYTVRPEDYGKYIQGTVIGTGDYAGMTANGDGKLIKAKDFSAYITGDAYIGRTLTATTDPADATVEYQWRRKNKGRDYTDIEGATSSTYTISEDDLDKYICVVATGTGNYTGTTRQTGATRKVAQSTGTVIALDSVKITGANEVDGILKVAVEPAGATVSIQWQKSNSPDGSFSDITGATGASYSPIAEDEGSYIRVVVRGTGDYDGSLTGTTTDQVAPAGEEKPTDPETGDNLKDSSENTEYETNDNFADDGYAGTNKMVDVYVTQGAQFVVVIPKKVVLDGRNGSGSYAVKVTGDIPGLQEITVAPTTDTMTLSAVGKDSIQASIKQDKTVWSVEADTMTGLSDGVSTDGTITTDGLTAGSWTGSFDFRIAVGKKAA